LLVQTSKNIAMKARIILTSLVILAFFSACKKDDNMGMKPLDPDTAGEASIDRFSSGFAHLFVRSAENGFPGANQPVDFDAVPAFNTHGLGPNGEKTVYYNFDVLSTIPAPIYALFRAGESTPVEGQLNIVNVIPGDPGYNDFWQVNKVTVPAGYVANTITSYDKIVEMGYPVTATNTLVNCPVVPRGSIARKRYSPSESADLTRGWYKDKVVYYFNFFEKELMTVNGMVPTSDIFVCFEINPDQPDGGPASGFKTEDGMATGQTHNIPETLPADAAYSPLWDVQIYNNSNFGMVDNLATAMSAQILARDAVMVNCPIVSVIGNK
jgi:hypothetical protein